MKNQIFQKRLSENGKIAIDLLVDKLNSLQGIQIIQKSVKIDDLWAVVFDVHLPNETGHIEFTAIQTGWGGDSFQDPSVMPEQA